MEVSITLAREMASVLPKKVSVTFFDPAREYDVNEQYAERLATDTANVQTLELPIVLSATEAAEKAEMLLYIYWLERHDISFSLPPSYNRLEPGDVITINAKNATYEVRLVEIEYTSDNCLNCKGKLNSASTYVSHAVGAASSFVDTVLSLAGDTNFELLDIPCLKSTMNQSGFIIAASGSSSWPGGVVLKSDDAGQTWVTILGFTKPGSKLGSATNTLPNVNTTLLDKANILNVTMSSGALVSVTEASMLNGSNFFAYGVHGRWEIIAAQSCVLQGNGSYNLSQFLRGQFGTEMYCGSHVAGDIVVPLELSSQFVTVNTSQIGLSRSYIGVTNSQVIGDQVQKQFAYMGVNLECLSPVYLNGNMHPTTNDWTLTWIRRTRIGGEWRDLVDVTLSEASESYEIDIFSDATYTVLKRTLTSSTQTVGYTSAQQVLDFGSNQATLYVKIYQISNIVGRGYPLIQAITR